MPIRTVLGSRKNLYLLLWFTTGPFRSKNEHRHDVEYSNRGRIHIRFKLCDDLTCLIMNDLLQDTTEFSGADMLPAILDSMLPSMNECSSNDSTDGDLQIFLVS